MAGLLLPAMLALINLRYAPTTFPWTLVLMLALAVPIAARMHFYQREQRWARRRMASPIGLGGRFVIVGTVLGLLVTLVSAQTPAAWSHLTFQPLIEEIGETYQNASERTGEWLEGLAGTERERISDAGSYSAFDDAFSIGGPLNLTDQPEVLVQTTASQAPYLTAHTYDEYTGRGWASSTRESFGQVEVDGGRLAPELLFEAGQEVVLTDDIRGSRVAQSTTITPLSGPSGVVFSVDTYLTADIQTVVRMSWQRLENHPFSVTTDTLNTLPPDIQKIGNLLLQAELSGAASDWGPEAVSPDMQREIEAEVDALAGRGVLIRWDATTDGIIQKVYITGRLPVFDDVEAVYPRHALDSQADSSYQVRSLASVATPEELVAAPTTYPDWVADRYLDPGDTVTPRTTQLAMDVVGDATDPYTQASLVESFLRDHIDYDEMVEAPPEGADLVDYVLFDFQRGYCEHYSAAMTVMMRSLGVPARTVVGYYPGEFDDGRGGYLYRQYNAHAWTEVFFPGYGWIPFEPTANRPLEEREGSLTEEETQLPVPTQAVPTPDVSDENIQSTPIPENRTIENPGPPQPMIVPEEDGGGTPGWVLPAVLSTAGVALAGGAIWLAWNWKLRKLSPIEALFAKTQRVGRIGGVHNGPTTTPREYASRFSQKMPGMSAPVRRIVQVYESDQFGPAEADDRSLASARAAWQELRRKAVRMLVRVRRKRTSEW
jgi:transglutaminase-like putative cysteine protease